VFDYCRRKYRELINAPAEASLWEKLPELIRGEPLLSYIAPEESLWENAFGRRNNHVAKSAIRIKVAENI